MNTTLRARILIVEDSPTQAAETEAILEDAGFRARVARSAEEALRAIAEESFDLVVSDVLMPGFSGFELCRRLREEPKTCNVPVLLVTCLNEMSDVVTGLESGADGFLIKPYRPEDLVVRVHTVLERAPGRQTAPPVPVRVLDRTYVISRDRETVVAYMAAAFEECVRAKRREWRSQEAEARAREEQVRADIRARFANEVGSPTEPQAVYEALSAAMRDLLDFDVSLSIVRTANGGYETAAVAGPTHAWTRYRGARVETERVEAWLARLRGREQIDVDAAGLPVPLPAGSAGTACVLADGKGPVGVQISLAPGALTERQRRVAVELARVGSRGLQNARLIEALREANRLKSHFLNTLSHELRTPLQVMYGYLELLSSESFGSLNEAQRHAVQRLEHSAVGLGDMIDQILELNQIEAGSVPLTVTPVDPQRMLGELRAWAEGRASRSTIELAWELDERVAPPITDGHKLQRVLHQLVDNALKFTEQGRVTVSASGDDEVFEITVADTGIGIPEEARDLIFEPFRQVDDSMTRPYGGLGLGLYVARRLLDVIGGRMSMESEVGCGSVFRVQVPLRHPAAIAVTRRDHAEA